MYREVNLSNEAEKISATIGQNEKACGKILNTKNIEPTIVNGTAAIPAAVIARTTLNWASFPIGPMT